MVVSSPSIVLTTDLRGQNYKDFDNATKEWNKALQKPAVMVTTGPVSKNPTIMDGKNSVTIGNLQNDVLGKTYIKTESGTTNKREVDIVIDPMANRDVFKTTALHEIGHALGAGHTSNTNTIMNPTIEIGGNTKPQTKITQEDINAVRHATGTNINYLV